MVTGMAHGDLAQSAARTPSGQVSRHGPAPSRQPIVLNVAGPRESKEPGLAAAVEKYILQVISTDKESS